MLAANSAAGSGFRIAAPAAQWRQADGSQRPVLLLTQDPNRTSRPRASSPQCPCPASVCCSGRIGLVCYQVGRLGRVAAKPILTHTRTFRPAALAGPRFVPGFRRYNNANREQITSTGAQTRHNGHSVRAEQRHEPIIRVLCHREARGSAKSTYLPTCTIRPNNMPNRHTPEMPQSWIRALRRRPGAGEGVAAHATARPGETTAGRAAGGSSSSPPGRATQP
jgi:hypothetical protein